MRVGILGGTFNPIHTGHLILAEEAREKLKLDRMIFVPAKIPPHKNRKGVASARDRYRMVVLATRDNTRFSVSTAELRRSGKSYSIDTLEYFRKKYGREAQLIFLIGSDSLSEMSTWKNIDRVLGLAQFMVARRPGYAVKNFPPRIKRFPNTEIQISSTQIRLLLKEGKSIRYLVPEAVRQYIQRKKLYR